MAETVITSPRAEQSAVLVGSAGKSSCLRASCARRAGDVAFTPQQVSLGPKYEARVPGSNKEQDCVQAAAASTVGL